MSAVDLAEQPRLIKISTQYLSGEDLSQTVTAMQAVAVMATSFGGLDPGDRAANLRCPF